MADTSAFITHEINLIKSEMWYPVLWKYFSCCGIFSDTLSIVSQFKWVVLFFIPKHILFIVLNNSEHY